MVTLRSTRYRGLVISDLDVRFVDGVLETSDERVIARARRLGSLGVTVEATGGPEPVRVERRESPRGNSSRQAWADYADSLGIDYPEGARRDDIRAAVEAADDSDKDD